MSASGSSDLPPGLCRVLCGVAALAPLPFGSNRPWAWSLLALIVSGLLIWLFVWRLLYSRRREGWPRWLPWLGGLWLAGCGWALVQAMPGVPVAWHHPVWGMAGLTDGRVAINPDLALQGAMRLLAWGGAFVLALACGTERPRQVVVTLAGAAGVYAVYGLVVYLSGTEMLLWWDKWAYRGVVTATFVNRNGTADMAGLGLLCAAVWFVRTHRKPVGLPLIVAAVCGLALMLTRSRAGVVASGLGLVVLFGAVAVTRRWSWQRVARRGGSLALLAILVMPTLGMGVAERLSRTDIADNDRTPVHEAIVRAIADQPWRGQGLGGFEAAFAPYRPPALPQRWDRAHSVYLETTFELGLPASLALGGAVAGVGAVCLTGVVRRRRRGDYPALGVAALALAAGHGLWDFAPQLPANALWLAVLLGVGAAQSSPTRWATTVSAAGSSARARR